MRCDVACGAEIHRDNRRHFKCKNRRGASRLFGIKLWIVCFDLKGYRARRDGLSSFEIMIMSMQLISYLSLFEIAKESRTLT